MKGGEGEEKRGKEIIRESDGETERKACIMMQIDE